MSTHSKAADKFVLDSRYLQWHDRTFWGVREARDRMARSLDEWEDLRLLASEIKDHTLGHLADYAERFADRAEANGVIVHWAGDAAEMRSTVLKLLSEAGVKKVVKSKSMLTEECELNPWLEEHGIEVVETDLGERILQLAHQRPSHIVMPAIHLDHHTVGELFRRELGTEPGNDDPAYLTYQARLSLRRHFLTAGAAITGANFGVAETGDVVVCTNEGNADMCVACAPMHIACIGLEKIIPDLRSLAVFQRLLARSATGQPTTAFTSHFRTARPGAAPMHIVIVDNGRSRSLANASHRHTLRCLRCGACMNTCPVYRRSGGFSYSYFIPGPIGINLGMLADPHKYAGNVSACSLCLSCQNVCPVRIDLGDQIYRWRQQLAPLHEADARKRVLCRAMSALYSHPGLYRVATGAAHLVNHLPHALTDCSLNPWAYAHDMPHIPDKPFHAEEKS